MVATLITIRNARPADAEEIAEVHDAAWRDAYRGIIPGRELEKMVARRGPKWWHNAIVSGTCLAVLDFDESIGGYASYGRNRLPTMPYQGEIFELYLAPEFQGLGFGRRLFEAARKDLVDHGFQSLVVWALAGNERATGFYRHIGGKIVRRGDERFGEATCERIAFGFS
jgi:ribosomal protein S18 acetylase RimI-like enzyme